MKKLLNVFISHATLNLAGGNHFFLMNLLKRKNSDSIGVEQNYFPHSRDIFCTVLSPQTQVTYIHASCSFNVTQLVSQQLTLIMLLCCDGVES